MIIKTFNDLTKVVKKEGRFSKKLDGYSLDRAAFMLDRADRGYQEDNLDPTSQGNYLQDFLVRHGDEPAHNYIKFFPGCAHGAGRGLVIFSPDWKKVRRRIEDYLRKAGNDKIEEVARYLNISVYTE